LAPLVALRCSMFADCVALFLTEAQNRYQQLLHADAVEHAERCGIRLEVSFCRLGVALQIEQLRAAIARPPGKRPRAVLVLPAEDASVRDAAREVVAAGVGWVLLTRRAAFLDRLPYEFPWAFQGASTAFDKTFSLAARKTARLDAIACQNDEIALAAVDALARAAQRLERPELARVEVFGCDGLPDAGQRYVREGKLRATVVVPPTTGAAILALANAFGQGVKPPVELSVPCTPLPSESDLARAAGRSG
jgi:ABC-type sugar transport system substrate-binding protein